MATSQTNPFDIFDAKPSGNPFDQFDKLPQQVVGSIDRIRALSTKPQGRFVIEDAPQKSAREPKPYGSEFLLAAGHNLAKPFHGIANIAEQGIAGLALAAAPESEIANWLGKTAMADQEATQLNEQRYQESVRDNAASYAGATVGTILPYTMTGAQQGLKAVGDVGGSALQKIAPQFMQRMAGNAGSGAVQGLAIGAATAPSLEQVPEGVQTGMTTGLVAGALAPKVFEYAARGAGWANDLLRKRLVDIKAGKVMRDAAAKELPQIMAILKIAPDDLSAAQAAAPVGSTKFSSLGELAAKNDSQYHAKLTAQQQQELTDQVARVAGGYTQTEAKHATGATQKALNQLTTPMRETELGAANTAGQLIPKLEQKIADKTASNASAMQNAGQMYSEFGNQTNQAWKTADRKLGAIGDVKVNRNVDQAIKNYEGAADFANVGKQRLAERTFAENQLASLEAHGLKPLDITSVTAKITRKISDPKIAGNKAAQTAMSNVADEIATWSAKNGGVIDAEALYSIRKNSVNSTIDQLLGNADPKVKAKAAAGVLETIKPIIDDAIETAGGTGWKAYLNTHAEGMKIVNQQKLGAKALELLNTSPKSFLKLVYGNDPKTVRKIFESEFDIAKAMGDKYKPLTAAAAKVERDINLKELAAAGNSDLANILMQDTLRGKLPGYISWKASTVNKMLDVAEHMLNKKTMTLAYLAMRNGKDAAALMNTLSTVEKNAVLKAIKEGGLNKYVTPLAVAASQEEK